MKSELKPLCGQFFFDEPMSRHTSIRVGGPADVLLYPQTVDEVTHLLAFARKRRLPCFLIGSGSNLLVRDKGIRGLVLSLVKGFNTLRLEGETVLFAEGGVGLPRLVDFSAEQGLSGLEPVAGIPGNVGGGLAMNAGTPEGEIGEAVTSVSFIDREGRLATWTREKIRFGYRETHFPPGSIILSARFGLRPSTPEAVRGEVQRLREERGKRQPLNIPSVGSVFKNPKKGFAGAYIEDSGLKSVRVGGARISPKHANFIVNEGGAKARDVLALMGLIRDKVKEKFGILLEPEVRVVGEE